MSQLSKNTADLDALIAKANALPDAGSGGGGAVETCTVHFTALNGFFPNNFAFFCYTKNNTIITEQVPCNYYDFAFDDYAFEADKNTLVVVSDVIFNVNDLEYRTISGGRYIYVNNTVMSFTLESDEVSVDAG